MNKIFEWENWDTVDTMQFMFYDCTFLKDFGPWKAGHRAASLSINFETDTLEEYSGDGVVATYNFTLV